MLDDSSYNDPLRPATAAYLLSENRRLTRKLRTARLAVAILIVTLAIVAMRAWN